jgi:hypothetical protein
MSAGTTQRANHTAAAPGAGNSNGKPSDSVKLSRNGGAGNVGAVRPKCLLVDDDEWPFNVDRQGEDGSEGHPEGLFA